MQKCNTSRKGGGIVAFNTVRRLIGLRALLAKGVRQREYDLALFPYSTPVEHKKVDSCAYACPRETKRDTSVKRRTHLLELCVEVTLFV